jgi:preprotein translocase subunit SecD
LAQFPQSSFAMQNLKTRLAVIAALVLLSAWQLWPRTVVERISRDGVFVDDTVSRVPLKLGLDLQGGMHLALEVDQSKQTVENVSDALDRALKVVRTRIDEFGVSEPVVQKVGNDRIIVELPGISDPQARLEDVVQKSAFLQFQITDETQALEQGADPATRPDHSRARAGVGATVAAGDTHQVDAGRGAMPNLFAKGDSASRAPTRARPTGVTSAGTSTDRSVPPPSSCRPGSMPGRVHGEPRRRATTRSIRSLLALPGFQGALPPGKDAPLVGTIR